jgi:putative N6-adenine-specific DNA methylase
MNDHQFFSPCPRGLEATLAAELIGLGANNIKPNSGGVAFSGDTETGWRVNLYSRYASRVLGELAKGAYHSTDDIYRLANTAVDWSAWHSVHDTLRIDVVANNSPLKSLQFTTLRIKDGICDHYRERTGERPSVDTRFAVRNIVAYISAEMCILYMDWSGESLFKRGWRMVTGDAPLKENLASGLVALTGWKSEMALYDPFCGSGTVVIEAACQALNIPAGLIRRFSFERFEKHDAAAFQRMKSHARNAILTPQQANLAPIVGSDITPAVLAAARENAERAGLPEGVIEWKQLDALNAHPHAANGILLTNPPYGERLDMRGRKVLAQDDRFWPAFGDALKQRFNGWNAWLLTSDMGLPGKLRLKESKRTPLFNGAIECRLFGFDLYQGSKKIRPDRESQSPS